MTAMPRPDYLDRPIADWLLELTSDDPLQRRLAAYALASVGHGAPAVISALEATLRDPVSFVRVWAGAALTRLDPTSPAGITALVTAMRDPLGFVRSLAAWHLGRIGADLAASHEVLSRLEILLEDANPSVRTEASVALQRLRNRGRPPFELSGSEPGR